MADLARNQNQAFDQRLESLRGIAALAVVITHSIAVLRIDGQTAFWKLSINEHSPATWLLQLISAAFNAGSAVVLFFVLSGYVLSLAVQRLPENHRWTSYAIRRALRLFPPMWISIFIAWGVLSVVKPIPLDNCSEWFTGCFASLSGEQVVKNLFLFDFAANPGTWTMYVETIGSLAIPFLVFASARLSYRNQSVVLILFAIMTLVTRKSLTVDYLMCFYAGVMIAMNPGVRLISSAKLSVSIGFSIFVLQRLLVDSSSASIVVNTIGSTLIIQGVKGGAADRLLESYPLRSLGRCSYSLYLSHLVVLYLVGRFAASRFDDSIVSTLMVLAVTVPVSFVIAQVGYYLVEQPSMNLGKILSRKLSHATTMDRESKVAPSLVTPSQDVLVEASSRTEPANSHANQSLRAA